MEPSLQDKRAGRADHLERSKGSSLRRRLVFGQCRVPFLFLGFRPARPLGLGLGPRRTGTCRTDLEVRRHLSTRMIGIACLPTVPKQPRKRHDEVRVDETWRTPSREFFTAGATATKSPDCNPARGFTIGRTRGAVGLEACCLHAM